MADPTDASTDDAVQPPAITVLRGNPTPEEVAALTVVLSAMSGGEQATAGRSKQGWASPFRSFTQWSYRGAGWGRG